MFWCAGSSRTRRSTWRGPSCGGAGRGGSRRWSPPRRRRSTRRRAWADELESVESMLWTEADQEWLESRRISLPL
ncbi:hypothetical protein BJF79_30440 [Actinomadura sp. CNU-125]|nr:hypothetical protein BJF79_30440 [Actinomadura sp. CNU-125]